jgi:uncharacterized membrane protein YadS
MFLLGFLLAAALNSFGMLPAGWHPALSTLGTSLITIALAGIGVVPAAVRHASSGTPAAAARPTAVARGRRQQPRPAGAGRAVALDDR